MAQQIAVATGSNGDMGQAICTALEADGYKIIGMDIGDAARGSWAYRKCDITDLDQLDATLTAIDREFGTIRVLVNNAGVWNGREFFDITRESYNRTFDTNARATFFATQQVARRLVELKETGAIGNIASVVGTIGAPITDYAGSKAAIILFTRSLGRALGPHGIRINAVAPGTIDTAMSRRLPPERRAQIHAGIALRRAGIPREIADTVAFLASEKASYLCGATLDVNGGLW